ncbi:MAG: hypothetical protein ACK55I_33360, partial [bacterium]
MRTASWVGVGIVVGTCVCEVVLAQGTVEPLAVPPAAGLQAGLQEWVWGLRHRSWTSHRPQGWWPRSWARMQGHQRETCVLNVLCQGVEGQWR